MTDAAIIYRSHVEAIEDLPEAEQLKAYKALIQYCMDDQIPEGGIERFAVNMAKPLLDKWKAKREAGAKGGSTSKQAEANGSKRKQTEATESKPKQTEANESKTKQPEAKEKEKVKEKVKVKDKKRDVEQPPLMAAVAEIIDHLNAKAGTNYQHHNRTAAELIRGRLSEKHTVEDFITVIDKKTAEWKDDPEMCGFLRPSTLFAKAHFEEYLNQPTKAEKRTAFHNFPARSDPGSKALVTQLIAAQR